mmetsp:Transcript_4220/g.12690  ORF Transcript_4220/g.12690 Transcript_4220/m.12690 type:complete len:285 (+) Transcript_4220:320-1174(+)
MEFGSLFPRCLDHLLHQLLGPVHGILLRFLPVAHLQAREVQSHVFLFCYFCEFTIRVITAIDVVIPRRELGSMGSMAIIPVDASHFRGELALGKRLPGQPENFPSVFVQLVGIPFQEGHAVRGCVAFREEQRVPRAGVVQDVAGVLGRVGPGIVRVVDAAPALQGVLVVNLKLADARVLPAIRCTVARVPPLPSRTQANLHFDDNVFAEIIPQSFSQSHQPVTVHFEGRPPIVEGHTVGEERDVFPIDFIRAISEPDVLLRTAQYELRQGDVAIVIDITPALME